jgi:hypothetical protein
MQRQVALTFSFRRFSSGSYCMIDLSTLSQPNVSTAIQLARPC